MLCVGVKLNKILASKTNQNIEKIQIDTERDNYFDAYEALEYGLIDAIIEKNEH